MEVKVTVRYRKTIVLEALDGRRFFTETGESEIESEDVAKAYAIAKERRCYAFVFSRRLSFEPVTIEGESVPIPDKELSRSGTYFVDGIIERYDDVSLSQDIQRGNMRGNGYPVAVTAMGRSSYFGEGDVVLSNGKPVDLPGIDEYRRAKLDEWKKERP